MMNDVDILLQPKKGPAKQPKKRNGNKPTKRATATTTTTTIRAPAAEAKTTAKYQQGGLGLDGLSARAHAREERG